MLCCVLCCLRMLRPGVPLPPDACEVHVAASLSSFAFSSLRVQQYQAVLINSGWEAVQQQGQPQQQGPQQPQGQPPPPGRQAEGGGGVTARLAALPIPRLCPKGFIMIWANKEHLSGAASRQLCSRAHLVLPCVHAPATAARAV